MWIDLLAIALGLALMIFGADSLVRGAAGLALRLGISPLVVGLTVVAFGTSAPELVVGIKSALGNRGDLAVGTVIGSNIFNLLLILGVAGLFSPIAIPRDVFRLDAPFLVVATVALCLLAIPGAIEIWSGLLLIAGIVLFLGTAMRRSFKQEEIAHVVEDEVPQVPRSFPVLVVLTLLGLVLLKFGGDLLIDGGPLNELTGRKTSGAVGAAIRLGVSEAIIGLTIVAVGSSLPELVTAVMASLKGHPDLVVGNVVGSNIFNIFAILGVSAMFGNLDFGPDIDAVKLGFLLGGTLLTIVFMRTGWRLARWEAAIMVLGCAGYVTLVVVTAK